MLSGFVRLVALWGLTAAAVVCPPADTDVSGSWDMTVESSQGTAHPSMVLRQSGETVSGTYKGRMGEASFKGTLKDGRIQFAVTLKFQEQPFTTTYTGTVRDDTMKGTARFGDSGSGTWSARRK